MAEVVGHRQESLGIVVVRDRRLEAGTLVVGQDRVTVRLTGQGRDEPLDIRGGGKGRHLFDGRLVGSWTQYWA
jgi:hypothetical protein